MVEFVGWVNYNPNFIYFNEEKKQYNSFPRYYKDGNSYSVYKIDGIDYINPTTSCIFYRGTIVQQDSSGMSINENYSFTLPKNIHEINQKGFDRIYDEAKEKINDSQKFPKYFYCPDSKHYIKALKIIISSWDNKEAYTGPTINALHGDIFTTSKVSLESIEKGIWIPCSKEEYEDALNKVLNEIK